MPQIIQITSEAIQAQIRRLLPSQAGFGIDMEASSVITPIIDITPAAEGSQLPSYLQQAYSYNDITAISVTNTTETFSLTPGFYRAIGAATVKASSTSARQTRLRLNDGAASKTFWGVNTDTGGINGEYLVQDFDETFYLNTGESFEVVASTGCVVVGALKQIADVYGNLTQPAGFTFE